MASVFATQLQPFEENQSPSPNETDNNPYETTLSRGYTTRSRSSSNGPSSPINTVNSLHRQLSGDPESPPPAWKRRTPAPSVGQHARSVSSGSAYPRTTRSPSESPRAQSARRHPHPSLTMTATQVIPPPMPGMFLHESPNASSTSLADANLALPNPAFKRRAAASNRSSIASNSDLNSLTGDELWALGQEQDFPDMNNPSRPAAERPLDTVRRMSHRIDQGGNYHSGLPGEVIWPSALGADDFAPPTKSKSSVSLAGLGKKTSDRRLSRRAKSRQASMESQMSPVAGKDTRPKSTPTSPIVATKGPGVLSSAHSSSTSLASQNLPPNKSLGNLSRPPSAYYSRDFLSSLAPREGGYAIAATMGNGLGAVGSMTVEERRRSSVLDDGRGKTVGSRAPLSKSAGMGRWSLDGGENFNRPYTTPSAATTSSNLSGPPLQPEPSPPMDDSPPALPAGAANPILQGSAASVTTSALTPASSNPAAPSPLSQHTSAVDSPVPAATKTIPPPPPIPPDAPAPKLNEKKSKKQLRKEVKEAEKAESIRVARERAEAARAAALKKQQQKDAEVKAKEEAKRKEKEEKARLKAEKKAAKGSFFGKKQSSVPPPGQRITPKGPVPAKDPSGSTPSIAAPAPQTNRVPVITPQPTTSAVQVTPGSQPFPKLTSSQSAYKVPATAAIEARQTHRSMPLDRMDSPPPSSTTAPAHQPASAIRPEMRTKRSLFGTIKKRFSVMGGDEAPALPKVESMPRRPANKSSTRTPTTATAQTSADSSSSSLTPRTESLNTDLSHPPVLPVSGTITNSDSSIIPLLPTNKAEESCQVNTAQVPASVDPVHQPSSPHFSSPEAPISAPLGPALAKSISHEASSSASPSSSLRRNRASLIGPRPMPHEGRSRATSVTTSEHSHSSPVPASYPFPTNHHNLTASPAPVHTSVHHQNGNNLSTATIPVTPSTSGESSTQYSQMSSVTPITSSSEFDADSGSRKPSMSSDAQGHLSEFGGATHDKARESSKDSNETVHVSRPILAL